MDGTVQSESYLDATAVDAAEAADSVEGTCAEGVLFPLQSVVYAVLVITRSQRHHIVFLCVIWKTHPPPH